MNLNFLHRWLFLLLVLFIFRNWITSNAIIGGDWPFIFDEVIKERSFMPPAWSYIHGNGQGGTIILYAIDSYLYFGGFLLTRILNIPWSIGEKIFWFIPFILLSFFSAYSLMKLVIRNGAPWQPALAGLLYSTNTYILMIVGGGQMGIALAYALLPFSIMLCIQLFQNVEQKLGKEKLLRNSILFSLVTGLLLMLDIRVAYLFMLSGLLLLIVRFVINGKLLINKNILIAYLLYIGTIPAICIGLLQSFWIIPLIFNPPISNDQLGIGQNIASSLRFYSFANFSHSLAFLHPNWPENIFGKTYFLRAEYLLLPVMAFVPLVFRIKVENKGQSQNETNLLIIFFAFLALLGIFLAKGATAPFENLYIWLFQNIPGFMLFRDPTKWYMLVAISYSVLIPIGLFKVTQWLKNFSKNKNGHVLNTANYVHVANLLLVGFVLYFLYLIKPAVLGQLQGTFVKKEIPQDYIEYKNNLLRDEKFSRQLWIPRQQRFAYVSRTHPIVEAESLFNVKNNTDLLKKMKSNNAEKMIDSAGIKYIVIPYDIYGDIFQVDRKYSETERANFVKTLDAKPWLQKINDNGLTIYRNNTYNDLFTLSENGELTYFSVENNYRVIINNNQTSNIAFSQNYSSLWKARVDGKIIQANKTKEGYMTFQISKVGMSVIDVFYDGEKYYMYGKILSGFTLLLLLAGYGVLKLKNS